MYSDFYELLGISEDASQEEIKQAYRDKVHEYHPDKNNDQNAQAKLDIVRRAYETLSTPEERAVYDNLGHDIFVNQLDDFPEIDEWPLTDPDIDVEPSVIIDPKDLLHR